MRPLRYATLYRGSESLTHVRIIVESAPERSCIALWLSPTLAQESCEFGQYLLRSLPEQNFRVYKRPSEKIIPARKKQLKNHLSPSRRQALLPFFVQRWVVVQIKAEPKPAAGFGKHYAISRSAKF